VPRKQIPLLFVLSVLIAGCAAPAGKAPDPIVPSVTVDDPGPVPVPEDPDDRTDAPSWMVGDWWEWEVSSEAHSAVRVKTVVAQRNDTAATLAGTDDETLLQAQPFHIVPLGVVGVDPVAWEVHGRRSTFVEFPLYAGKEWTGDVWFASGLRFVVDAVALPAPSDDTRGWQITAFYPNNATALIANWSIAWDQLYSLQIYFGGTKPFSEARVVDAGSGFNGELHLPVMRDIVVRSMPTSPGPGTFEVAAGEDRLMVACFLGGLPGHYEARILDPSNTPYECSQTWPPTGASPTVMKLVLPEARPGTWTLELTPGGPGTLLVEVVGFHFEHIHLAP
jgi:hypothetical protein